MVRAFVLFDGELLSFTLEVGVSVACSLLRQEDGHYEGECVDPSGDAALQTYNY